LIPVELLANAKDGFVRRLAAPGAVRELIGNPPQVIGCPKPLSGGSGFLAQDQCGAVKIIDGADEGRKHCAQVWNNDWFDEGTG
jgi:hypothetical protein